MLYKNDVTLQKLLKLIIFEEFFSKKCLFGLKIFGRVFALGDDVDDKRSLECVNKQ